MKKLLLTIGVASGMMWTLLAGDVIIGLNGKTKHQIIVPDQYENPISQEAVERSAKLIQEAFAANAVTLDIAKESQKDKEKHGIYLGTTKFAKENGVELSKLDGWQNIHKVAGKDIIIAGNDKPNPINAETKGAVIEKAHYYATLHSTAEFLYRYAGARFLKPGNDGTEFLPMASVSVPDNLDSRQEPFFIEHDFINRVNTGLYFIANHCTRFQRIWSMYGHQHPSAVPKDKYGKSNPEYYILAGGLRRKNTDLLCYSNKEVRELIYKHILEKCDEGYEIVEVGQPDGFAPCSCKECFELYGINPTTKSENGAIWYADSAWSEKLWIMHRDMALRLLKDRPGKKMMISAYSITAKPPRTIKEFPENVIIEMMQSTPENFKAWENIKTPGGYAAYLYTWGNGAKTPKNEVSYFGKENELFREKNVRVVQVNGKPFVDGLEGPNIYVYLRLGIDPERKNADELFREYLEASFREAETPMRRFFTKLQNAAMLHRLNEAYLAKTGANSIRRLGIVYTPELMNSLEEDLSRAEKTATQQKVKNRIATIRGEFDFLKHIVDVIYCWHNYQNRKDQPSMNQLLDAIDARNKHLDELISKKGTPYNPTRFGKEFFNSTVDLAPFNWNVEKMRKESIAMLKEKNMKAAFTDTVPALDSQVWGKAEVQKMDKVRGSDAELHAVTSFQILYDKDNLYIKVSGTQEPSLMKFESRGRDAEIWLSESIVINLSPIADKGQYYYLTYEPVENSYADAEHGFITDNYDPRYGWNDWTWNGDWKYSNKLDSANGKWESMATIPFKTLKTGTPKTGTIWFFNIGRVHFYPGTEGKAERENSVWTGLLNASKVPGDASLGELVFE